jgi:hypothetical protein
MGMIYRVGAIAAVCLVLVACRDAEGSTSEWEDWERHTVSVSGVTLGETRNVFGSFGAEVSVPQTFRPSSSVPGTMAFRMDNEDLPRDQTISSVSLSPLGPNIGTFRVEDMNSVSVGDRGYSGYRGVRRNLDENPIVEVVYLAGSQWWILRSVGSTDSLTDYDEELLDNIIDSIDHG